MRNDIELEKELEDKYNLNLLVYPTVKLLGEDGNALVIIGRCIAEYKKELRLNGYTEQVSSLASELLEKLTDANSYEELLCLVMANFEVE